MPFTRSTAEQFAPGILSVPVSLNDSAWQWGDNSCADGLRFLCRLAAGARAPIVEFGTFRGRTTYHLALHTRQPIYTVDLGAAPADETNANIENKNYGRYTPGEVFLNGPAEVRSRISLLIGDTATVDLNHLHGRADMVLVDAGHTYEACRRDSLLAFRLIRPGGIVLWDDYGGAYWPGVRQAVDELAATRDLIYLPRENFVSYRSPQEQPLATTAAMEYASA